MDAIIRRSAVLIVMVSAVLLPFSSGRAAQDDFPSRPIQIVVPFAAGGSLDLITRILAEKLREYLKEPVLVLNKPGAGTAVGAASSRPPSLTGIRFTRRRGHLRVPARAQSGLYLWAQGFCPNRGRRVIPVRLCGLQGTSPQRRCRNW